MAAQVLIRPPLARSASVRQGISAASNLPVFQSRADKGMIPDCALAHAMRDHTHFRHAVERDSSRLEGLARWSEAGFGFAIDIADGSEWPA